MKIEVAVVGALEAPLKNIFLAKGKAQGEDCTVLVRQSGKNAILCLHSSNISFIGKQAVVAYKGNTVCEANLKVGADLSFDVDVVLKESGQKKESLEEVVIRQGKQIVELTGMVESLTSLLEAKAAPAEPIEEKPKPE